MKPLFEGRSKQIKQVEFPDYFLAKNPFPSEADLTEGKNEGEDFYSLFCNQIYEKEINQIFGSIMDGSDQGKKKFWLLKNEKVAVQHNVSVVTGLFRALTVASAPRIFPAYVPFPVIIRDPLGGILQWFADRLDVERFRSCVYAFIYGELRKLEQSGTAPKTLPDIDVSDVLGKMNEGNCEVIDEIIFVEEPEEVEVEEIEGETIVQEERKESPADDKESSDQGVETAGMKKIDPEEAEAKKKELQEKNRIRNEFVLFMEGKIAASGFSPQAKSALAVGITEGFEKGRSYIGVGEYRETLKSLLSLTSLFYDNAVVILDRLDGWDMLEETQKATVIGALTEIDWLFGKFGLLALSSYKSTVTMIGEDFASSFQKLSFDLWPLTLDLGASISPEKAADLVSYFMQPDQYRKEKNEELKSKKLPDFHPFTDDGIGLIVDQVDGDIGKLLVAAGKLMEAGKAEQYALVDADFVKKHGF